MSFLFYELKDKGLHYSFKKLLFILENTNDMPRAACYFVKAS